MNNYTLTATNLNNQRHLVHETTAQRMRRLRQSIADIRASGGNPAAYERVLERLCCPTCANEGGCPDCGAE